MRFIPGYGNNTQRVNSRCTERKHNKHVLAELNYRPGNHVDFAVVFSLFYHQLCYFSRKMINDLDCAEDIVVDVLVKFWTQEGYFKSTASIKRWLYKCTYNESLRHLQRLKNKLQTSVDSLCDHVPDNDNKLSRMMKEEQLIKIGSLVDTLPKKCKSIIKLHYFLELDNREIAGMFNISVHTVKNQKARGIYLLKKRIGQLTF